MADLATIFGSFCFALGAWLIAALPFLILGTFNQYWRDDHDCE